MARGEQIARSEELDRDRIGLARVEAFSERPVRLARTEHIWVPYAGPGAIAYHHPRVRARGSAPRQQSAPDSAGGRRTQRSSSLRGQKVG